MIDWAKRHPAALLGAVVLDAALVWLACRVVVSASHRGPPGVNWMPFAREFARSYDVAALQIGRTMAVYAVIAAMLAVQFLPLPRRRGVVLTMLAAFAIGLAHQVARYLRLGDADITEPVLAVMTAGATVTLVMLLVAAVRAACRRKSATSVAVERRRVPYRYVSDEPAQRV
jgi:hypothetical protein